MASHYWDPSLPTPIALSVRMSDWLAELQQNLSYSLRTLRHNKGFTAVALLTLALAIGANTAIFSVTNAVLLQPPPYGQPDRLIAVYENNIPSQSPRNQLSAADLLDYRAGQRSLTNLAAFAGGQYTYTDPRADPLVLRGMRVRRTCRHAAGGAFHGRTFAADEDSPAKRHVVVLSYDLWQRAFGGDPATVGRNITLNDESYAVVGVMPQGFSLGYREDSLGPARLVANPRRRQPCPQIPQSLRASAPPPRRHDIERNR